LPVASGPPVGVILRSGCGVEQIARRPAGGFTLTLTDGTTLAATACWLATGGCRRTAHGRSPKCSGTRWPRPCRRCSLCK
jgi:hypothetical protein